MFVANDLFLVTSYRPATKHDGPANTDCKTRTYKYYTSALYTYTLCLVFSPIGPLNTGSSIKIECFGH